MARVKAVHNNVKLILQVAEMIHASRQTTDGTGILWVPMQLIETAVSKVLGDNQMRHMIVAELKKHNYAHEGIPAVQTVAMFADYEDDDGNRVFQDVSLTGIWFVVGDKDGCFGTTPVLTSWSCAATVESIALCNSPTVDVLFDLCDSPVMYEGNTITVCGNKSTIEFDDETLELCLLDETVVMWGGYPRFPLVVERRPDWTAPKKRLLHTWAWGLHVGDEVGMWVEGESSFAQKTIKRIVVDGPGHMLVWHDDSITHVSRLIQRPYALFREAVAILRA